MKILKYALVVALGATALSACKKYPGDTYDFSQTSVNYVRFSSAAPIEVNAETIDTFQIDPVTADTVLGYYYVEAPGKVTVESRVAYTTPVNFTLKVKSVAFAERTINGTIPAQALNVAVPIAFPAADFNGAEEITGTIELVSAEANGTTLRLGYPKVGDRTKINFTAYNPDLFIPE